MGFAELVRSFRKRKAIKLYLQRMGPLLAKRYGKSEYYKPEQVKQTAKEAGLPTDDLCYALSIFCDQDAFDLYHADSGEECSYWEMRTEVADHHFGGNASFTTEEVAATHSHAEGGHHSGGDFGGHHGGTSAAGITEAHGASVEHALQPTPHGASFRRLRKACLRQGRCGRG